MIKEPLKKKQRVVDLYRAIKLSDRKILSMLSPTIASKRLYKKKFDRKLDLENPQFFNEKLMWLKLNIYSNNSLVTKCADKYRVREYVKECGYGDILNDLLGVWDSVDDIDWEALPNKFALKCNHGAGYNIICDDKRKIDIKDTKYKLKKWMKEDYWKLSAEMHYKYIPKKIICEKYIGSLKGSLPEDYKVFCFNGDPIFIGKYIDRDKNNFSRFQRGLFNFNWEPLNNLVEHNIDMDNFTKPGTLDQMYAIAKDLCKPFPFVRIDFYESDGKVIFGEFTFTPVACLATYFHEQASKELGKLLILP